MNKIKHNTLKDSIKKSLKGLWVAFPMIIGTVALVSLISMMVPQSVYTAVFGKNVFLDTIIGALIGGISAGNPITSYIFGGEMLSQGVNLLAVTSFLVAWVTVGLIQFPAESAILGKKFAIIRNISAFLFSIIVAIITVIIVGVIQ